jgi:hypothetical protein
MAKAWTTTPEVARRWALDADRRALLNAIERICYSRRWPLPESIALFAEAGDVPAFAGLHVETLADVVAWAELAGPPPGLKFISPVVVAVHGYDLADGRSMIGANTAISVRLADSSYPLSVHAFEPCRQEDAHNHDECVVAAATRLRTLIDTRRADTQSLDQTPITVHVPLSPVT